MPVWQWQEVQALSWTSDKDLILSTILIAYETQRIKESIKSRSVGSNFFAMFLTWTGTGVY